MFVVAVYEYVCLWKADYEYNSVYRDIVLGISRDKVENYLKKIMLASDLQIPNNFFKEH